MANYDFSTLGSSDFEDLVCDLLNADNNQDTGRRYKTFKDGKDKGIDFLHSTPNNEFQEIGQAKHYYRSGFDLLYSKLKNDELPKVKKLDPGKYLLATSVDLGVSQTESLKKLFEPYIRTLSDIYGKKDLNQLIESYDDVLRNHYKLWFSDTTVLEQILKHDLHFRSQDYKEHLLKKNIRLYVTTNIFFSAQSALATNRFIVITGEPGVGKSALAEMLLFDYLKEGFDFLHIYDEIKEFEKFIKPDESKQIVYYDDFLGSNSEEINRARGRERALTTAIRKVINTPNKYLILTTRTHILNSAIFNSEQLRKSPIKIGQTVFELNEYTPELKAQLLLNHIDESEIKEDLKAILLEEKMFDWIINHHSYSPRSIEFITSNENVGVFNPKEFKRFIKENFNNPAEIWKHAYLHQIGNNERMLLNTILTFDKPVAYDVLEKAFINRQKYNAIKGYHSVEYVTFRDALVKLNNGFIRMDHNNISLVNPSLRDFLNNYLSELLPESIDIINSIAFVEQLRGSFFKDRTQGNITLSEAKERDIIVNFRKYLGDDVDDGDIIFLFTTIQNKFDIEIEGKEQYLISMIEEVADWEYLYDDYTINIEFTEFLKSAENSPTLKLAINSKIEDIIASMVLSETDIFKAVDMLEKLTETRFIDFEYFDSEKIRNYLDDLFGDYIFNEVDWLRDWVTDEGEVAEKKQEIRELGNRIIQLGIDYEVDMSEFNVDWWEIARNNDFKRLMEKDD